MGRGVDGGGSEESANGGGLEVGGDLTGKIFSGGRDHRREPSTR